MNRLLGWILLALVWLRPHPPVGPTFLAVYAGDIGLAAVLVLALLINRRKVMARRLSLPGLFGLAVLLAYPAVVLIFAEQDPERAVMFVKVLFYAFVVGSLTLLVDASPTFRHVLRWQSQRIFVALGIAILLVQLIAPPLVIDLVHLMWGEDRLRSLTFAAPRAYGPFYNANWYGIVLAFVSVHILWRIVGPQRSWLDAVLLGGILPSLVATGSRSGIVAALVGITVLGLRESLRMRGRTLLRLGYAAGTVAGALFVVYRFTDVFSSSRFTELLPLLLNLGAWRQIASIQARVELWELYGGAILAHPVAGPGQVFAEATAHNSFLFAASMFGVVGGASILLAQLFLIVGMARGTMSSSFTRFSSYVLVLVAGGLTAEFWYSTQIFLALLMIVLAASLEGVGRRGPFRRVDRRAEIGSVASGP